MPSKQINRIDARGILFVHDEGLIWGKSPDSQQARSEGWDLFERSDTGELEIEVISDLEEVGCTKPIGTTDDEVVNVIVIRAMQGSRMHMLALYLQGYRVEKGNDVWVPRKLVHPKVIWEIERAKT